MRPLVLLLLALRLAAPCAACGANEILLRNRTCFCPFFKFDGRCLRRRYQTTINSTLDALYSTSRHLLSSGPLLLTVDATNEEAMRALAASLGGGGVGTVVTRVVDAADVLVGADASATLEIVNVSVDARRGLVGLTVDCRFPQADYFFLYMHLGAAAPPCPPFDAANRCCRGDMGGAEFLTADNVDCTSDDPFAALDRFVQAWGGAYLSADRQLLSLQVDLGVLPSAIDAGARVYRLGVGMVVFGRLAQNTEARVQLVLNSSSVATSVGAFQYSAVEYSRLQLEACGADAPPVAHLVIKAPGIESVQSIRFQSWDGGEWVAPNCSGPPVQLGGLRLSACNVSVTADLVDIYVSMRNLTLNSTTTLYVLLQRGAVLTRVVAKTDAAVLDHCRAPLRVDITGYNAFTLEVTQGSQVKYRGPPRPVQLTDVAALTIRLASNSPLYAYALENVSVVYSLLDPSVITPLMPDGRITPELARLCDAGTACLVEDLLLNGACQTDEKCEVQRDGVFLMPLYPWGAATLKNGTCTILTADIRETLASRPNATLARRLMSWIWGP